MTIRFVLQDAVRMLALGLLFLALTAGRRRARAPYMQSQSRMVAPAMRINTSKAIHDKRPDMSSRDDLQMFINQNGHRLHRDASERRVAVH